MKLKSLLYKLITAIFVLGCLYSHATPTDSIGIENFNGKRSVKYKVDKGNTFYSISRRFNSKVEDIKSLNKITELKIDQIIFIPISGKLISTNNTSNIHIVKPGETLYTIARQNNISVDELKKLNNLNEKPLAIGQQLKTSTKTNKKTSSNKHIVKKGETLYSIATLHNTTVDNIKRWNQLTKDGLTLNQQLLIKSAAQKKSPYKKTNVHLINSKSNKLDQTMSEILSPYGDLGDIIQITYKGNQVFARIIGRSDDKFIYASNKIFKTLEIDSFSKDVNITYLKMK